MICVDLPVGMQAALMLLSVVQPVTFGTRLYGTATAEEEPHADNPAARSGSCRSLQNAAVHE